MANIEKKFNLKATKNSSFNRQQNLANKYDLNLIPFLLKGVALKP